MWRGCALAGWLGGVLAFRGVSDEAGNSDQVGRRDTPTWLAAKKTPPAMTSDPRAIMISAQEVPLGVLKYVHHQVR